MKIQKAFSVLIILFVPFQICFGQEKPKAVLTDELKSIFCNERDLRRVDDFLDNLVNNQESEAYIISYGGSEFPGRFSSQLKTLKEHISRRNVPVEKIKFIRGANQKENLFQFWLVPRSAKPPIPQIEYKKQQITSSIIFDKSGFEIYEKNQIAFGGDEETCDRSLDFSGFADFMKDDSDLIGYIVAYSDQDKGKKFADKALKLTLNKIISDYKISHNRLKIIYGGMRQERGIELWLIPKDNKAPVLTANKSKNN